MAFMDKAVLGVKKMNWMGLALQQDCLLLLLLSQNPSSFFPAERHRTFGTLFRSKSQQNWIFGKSKARNFTHVFFVLLLAACSSFPTFFLRIMALQSNIWSRKDDIKNAANACVLFRILNLLT